MPHAKRSKNVLLHVAIEALSGDTLYQGPQGDEIDVAVDEARAGRIVRLQRKGHVVGGRFSSPRLGEVQVGRQAGIVRQQLANSNVFLPALGELRDVPLYRIIGLNLSLLEKLHDASCGRNNLRQ